ncbi:hypothetical protein U9M48_040754 [Paspalum notatum var. saurae]|uniref:Uncharacterized protein n=1 Tax=Paspalum notatum var. saurae TaxID=547442 RepID=A0AAQ3URA4_PASNO
MLHVAPPPDSASSSSRGKRKGTTPAEWGRELLLTVGRRWRKLEMALPSAAGDLLALSLSMLPAPRGSPSLRPAPVRLPLASPAPPSSWPTRS